jgi:RNA polymerase sigma-70 factor (ECF subfamily)
MNAKEYNRLVELFSDGLYRFLLKSIREEAEAEDLVQDTFEKLWKHKDQIEMEKAKSWLYSTAYHAMIDRLRKIKRLSFMEEISEDALEPEEVSYNGTMELLEKGLKQLPENQRAVLLLRDYEGYSYKEISGITGLNEAQVKVYIHRARIFLKSFLTKMENYHGILR